MTRISEEDLRVQAVDENVPTLTASLQSLAHLAAPPEVATVRPAPSRPRRAPPKSPGGAEWWGSLAFVAFALVAIRPRSFAVAGAVALAALAGGALVLQALGAPLPLRAKRV